MQYFKFFLCRYLTVSLIYKVATQSCPALIQLQRMKSPVNSCSQVSAPTTLLKASSQRSWDDSFIRQYNSHCFSVILPLHLYERDLGSNCWHFDSILKMSLLRFGTPELFIAWFPTKALSASFPHCLLFQKQPFLGLFSFHFHCFKIMLLFSPVFYSKPLHSWI